MTITDAPDLGERHILSPRETEVARMVAQGYPNKTIAAQLGITTHTVSSYMRRIFAKLGVRSRSSAVAVLADFHGDSNQPDFLPVLAALAERYYQQGHRADDLHRESVDGPHWVRAEVYRAVYADLCDLMEGIDPFATDRRPW